jgi:hypothetical protein
MPLISNRYDRESGKQILMMILELSGRFETPTMHRDMPITIIGLRNPEKVVAGTLFRYFVDQRSRGDADNGQRAGSGFHQCLHGPVIVPVQDEFGAIFHQRFPEYSCVVKRPNVACHSRQRRMMNEHDTAITLITERFQ